MVRIQSLLKKLKANRHTYYNLDKGAVADFQRLYNRIKKNKEHFYVTNIVSKKIDTILDKKEMSYLKKLSCLEIISEALCFHDEKVIFSVENRKSKIHGMGAFASTNIPARKKIGELNGEIISIREANNRVKNSKTDSISMVELSDTLALDASVNFNQLRFINHSCSPNTYMRIRGKRVEFYALKEIKNREELTCDYGETHHNGKKKCTCGSLNCKGNI